MAAEETHERRQEEQTSGRERRAYPRHAVDCRAEILPVSGSTRIPGRLSDLSLGGCLVIAEQRYTAGILVRVEVQFQLRGIAFRMVGVTVGSRDARIFAIRFLDMPARRRTELAEVLAEVETWNAAQAAALPAAPPGTLEAATVTAFDRETASDGVVSAAPATAPEAAPQMLAAPESAALELSVAAIEVEPDAGAEADPESKSLSLPIPGAPRERRAQSRHVVDTSAKLLLVKTAISMSGCIVNLSLGGCRIRTEERFNVGIYVRVEAEFYLNGLPFRVGGVSQAILDKNTIGIRFLDMSDRRRDQLAELISERGEAAALGQLARAAVEDEAGEIPAARS